MNNSAYDEIAEWYDECIRRGTIPHDVVLPALFALIGDIKGQHICDLACGQGVVARQLARQGGVIVGVDLSTKLLDLARQYQDAEMQSNNCTTGSITYLHGNAQRLAAIEDSAFDGVVCNMALMDIPDLTAALHTVNRILRPGGWFVFSVTHPCLESVRRQTRYIRAADGTVEEVKSYFVERPWRSDNPNGVRGRVDAHHRTLSTYVNTLLQVGLSIERLAEPQATGELAERFPIYQDFPAHLVVRSRKS